MSMLFIVLFQELWELCVEHVVEYRRLRLRGLVD